MKGAFLGVGVIGLALTLAATPAEAKKKAPKTVVGCVESHNNQYELTAVSKKGKTRHYTLAGTKDFSHEVGHRVKVTGTTGKGTLNVTALEPTGASCK